MKNTPRAIALRKEQGDICKKFCSPVVYPHPESRMGVAIHTLNRMPISACRMNSAAGTNGWYIWGGEHDDRDDFYQAVHLSHLPEILPQVLPYLALAPGFKFFIDDEGYEDVWCEPDSLPKE